MSPHVRLRAAALRRPQQQKALRFRPNREGLPPVVAAPDFERLFQPGDWEVFKSAEQDARRAVAHLDGKRAATHAPQDLG